MSWLQTKVVNPCQYTRTGRRSALLTLSRILPLDIVARNTVFLLSGVLVAGLLADILLRLGQLRPLSRRIASLCSALLPQGPQWIWFITVAIMWFWRNDINRPYMHPKYASLSL